MSRLRFTCGLFLIGTALLLSGCGSLHPKPVVKPEQGQQLIASLLPASVSAKSGWARDIYQALYTQNLAIDKSNICSVIAIAGQETGFNADPVVPGLAKIARKEIDRRAAQLPIPAFMISAALSLRSPDGRSYQQRLKQARTEKELSAIFEDFIHMVPLGERLFGRFNPVRTGGPMQVSIAFAEASAENYPWPVNGTIRQEVFTRRGGIWFGTAHLLGYPASYSQPLYRFADFNAGRYASRNAAFQAAVARLSGAELELDGDLIIHGSEEAGQTERAVRTLFRSNSERKIRRDLEKGDSADFETSDLYQQLFKLADRQAGKKVARERLPGIRLQSPKITRNLTTAWFAQRVNHRYQQCISRQ